MSNARQTYMAIGGVEGKRGVYAYTAKQRVCKVASASELRRSKSVDKTINYQQALVDEVKELPEEVFPNLLQIVHLFKESILLQSRQAALTLQVELAQWDRLSDEALLEFEEGL